jgi:acyl-CoA thioester hydrolase
MSIDHSASTGGSQRWSETEVRVRYADTDPMGVVYYANYLRWFEIGRVEYCRQRGLLYQDFEKKTQSFLAVAEAECRYHSPARYDDLLIIRTRLDQLRKRTLSFFYEIVHHGTRSAIASGRTVHVVVNREGRPKTFPADFRQIFF